MKSRKHSELIKAWADGHEIQFKNDFGCWQKVDLPLWEEDVEYRIKPRIVRREGWVNIGKYGCGLIVLSYGEIYASREVALACAKRIGTITARVEWEEEE